jgi:hypothetical protein
MTTDGTPSPLDPDFRSEAQRRRDGRIAAAQSQALTNGNADPGRGDETIRRLQAVRERLQSGPGVPPDQIEVIWPDEPGQRPPILVVRGELLLREPTAAPPGADHEDRAEEDRGGDTDAYEQAVELLGNLGYNPQVQRDHRRDVLPFQTFRTQDKDGAELVRNRNEVREATGVDVDLNYVCVTGYTTKDDDTPVLTIVDPAYPPPGLGPDPVLRPITIAVIDTGINREERTDGWLATIDETAQNEDLLDVLPANGILDASAGHGTFVSGVLQQVAPQCTVVVYKDMDTDGFGNVADIGAAIISAAAAGADIINLSAATPAVQDEIPSALLTAVQTVQTQYPDVLIVASAGNNGSDVPMYPAAIPGVIGVAALNPAPSANSALTPVDWSSFGDWVTCSAVGVGIASTFVPGTEDEANGTTEKFGPDAWAIWSGTSFSAPQIAGAVAWHCQVNPTPIRPLDALQQQVLVGAEIEAGYGAKVRLLPGS